MSSDSFTSFDDLIRRAKAKRCSDWAEIERGFPAAVSAFDSE